MIKSLDHYAAGAMSKWNWWEIGNVRGENH